MKLYQANLSPFAARCRIQIYAKGIDDIQFSEPPGGISSDEFKQVNPSGKIPALDVDGQVLAESEVICEYLEDRYPSPALRPEGALERAFVRLLSRATDHYLLGPLFELLPHMNPADRDDRVVQKQLDVLTTNLVMLERYLLSSGYKKGTYASTDTLTLADCSMVPALFVLVNVLPGFGASDPLANTPQLQHYWEAVQTDEHCQRVLGEMTEALAARMGGA